VLSRLEWRWQPPLPEHFERVRRQIESGVASKLSSPVLARWAGLSIPGLNRGFRRHFGTSPARYVTAMRVREATWLLVLTDNTIDAIAGSAGFPNRAYFSRVFKKVTGEAPATFRRKHQRVG